MEWVDEILEGSAGLGRPALARGALAEPLLGERDVIAILAAAAPVIAAVQGGDYTLQVTIGRVSRMADLDRVVRNPPALTDPLTRWWGSTFASPASLTLSAIERFVDGRLASFVAPLFARIGTPSGGVETALTLADDGGDARGARRVDGPTLLLPCLGGGELHIWTKRAFDEVGGPRPVSFELTALAPSASRELLAPGDAAFLPAGAAHRWVGEGLCVSLAIRWRDATRFEFLRSALSSELARTLDDLAAPVGFDSLDPASRWLEQQILGDGVEALDVGLAQWRTAALESRHRELLSNAGFEREPLTRDATALELDGCMVRRTRPFPILTHEHDGRLAVFVRGRSFTCKASAATRRLFERLGGDEPIAVDALRDACGLSARALDRLLRLLWSYRGLELEGVG
jgi:hypothetical protein